MVENAHPAITTEKEGQSIMAVRHSRQERRFEVHSNRSPSSPYLLSGGLFSCERCRSNMVGFMKTKDGHQYICNTVPNRRGVGCGTEV